MQENWAVEQKVLAYRGGFALANDLLDIERS